MAPARRGDLGLVASGAHHERRRVGDVVGRAADLFSGGANPAELGLQKIQADERDVEFRGEPRGQCGVRLAPPPPMMIGGWGC